MKFFKSLKRGNGSIKSFSSEDIEPEDILPDTSGGDVENFNIYNKLEVPVNTFGYKLIFSSIFLALSFLGFYTVYIFATNQEYYSALAERNAQQLHSMGSERGKITTSDGVVVAESTPHFNLVINPALTSKEDIEEITKVASSTFDNLSFERTYERIMTAHERNLGSRILARNLSEEEISLLSDILDEHDTLTVEESPLRYYPQDNLFSHLIGYASSVTYDDLENLPGEYTANDTIGKAGLERHYENKLRGSHGEFAEFVDVRGNIVSEEVLRAADKGANVNLTIDAELQEVTREALENRLEEFELERGAVVALNPQTGGVLSFVSLPDFNPNHFAKGLTQEQTDVYFNNHNQPLFNRITSGEYSTGSVIKPFLAAAALEENIIHPDTRMHTRGYIAVPSVFDPSVVYRFDDWMNHGTVDMRRAIAVSSNVYFYTIGGGYQQYDGLGITRMHHYLTKFGWGSPLGIDFGSERSGLIPTPEWKREVKNEPWRIGDTYNTSIGQGDLSATPLQIAASTAVFANGGTLFSPYAVEKVHKDGEVLKEREKGDIINDNFISQNSINVVREGMRDAVEYGSARFLTQLPEMAAGKTGTAQTSGENNSWFTAFAPYDNPSILLVVLLEEGDSSDRSVRVAYDILDYYLNK